MLGRKKLRELCVAAVEAVRNRDQKALAASHQAVAARLRKADPAESTDALDVLATALADVSLGVGGPLAVLAGALVEHGADPAELTGTVVQRIAQGLEIAAFFPALWEKAGDGVAVPGPDSPDLIPAAMERLQAAAEGVGLTEGYARGITEAWFTVGDWLPALLILLQREDVRKNLPNRGRLTEAAAAVREHIGEVEWAYGLLKVLDDEPVIVLHRATGRGYQVTIGGIGDNFQLHTLLAATLIGDPASGLIAGTPPTPEWIAAATDGDLQPSGPIKGQFNLVDGSGEWIWNEGRPADIPLLDGHRVVVLDPPPYERSWNVGRVYPLMAPSLTLDHVLTADEAGRWTRRISPDGRAS